MSRFRTDLRAFPRKSSVNSTKFPPVNDYACSSPSASPQSWATDMVVGLQIKTSSPPKDVKRSVASPKEKIRMMVNSKPKKSRAPSTKGGTANQPDKDNQDILILKLQLQELLDKISKLEKENEKLKARNASQSKTIEQLKEDNQLKSIKISELEVLLRQQELIHKNELDALNCQVQDKDAKITALENLLSRKNEEIEKIKAEFQKNMELKTKEHEDILEEAKANYDKELKIKDDKLRVLKSHMAEALKDNSRERQVQLEELARELKKVSEEAEILRMKMHPSKSSEGTCNNCQLLERELQNKIVILRDKEVGLIELQQLCGKMEKQLMEQDELLRLFAKSKGKMIR